MEWSFGAFLVAYTGFIYLVAKDIHRRQQS